MADTLTHICGYRGPEHELICEALACIYDRYGHAGLLHTKRLSWMSIALCAGVILKAFASVALSFPLKFEKNPAAPRERHQQLRLSFPLKFEKNPA